MPTEQSLEIKFHKFLGIFELTASIVILFVNLLTGLSPNTVTGIVLLILSIKTLTTPMIVITPTHIQMRNLLGMTLKEHPYKPEQVSVQDHLVYINAKKIFWTTLYDVSDAQLRDFFKQR